MTRRARPSGGVLRAALVLTTTLAAGSPARAASVTTVAAADGDLEAATAKYNEGLEALRAGSPEDAARKIEEALALVPSDNLEIRVAVLVDLVEARRQAFADSGDQTLHHLCAARDALTNYLDEADAAKEAPKKKKKYPDVRKIRKLRVELFEKIHEVERARPDASCTEDAGGDDPPAEQPPQGGDDGPSEGGPGPTKTPTDRTFQTYIIAGSVSAGVGAIMYGVMVAGLAVGRGAERDGEELVQMGIDSGEHVSMFDPAIAQIQSRGRTGNALAITGGIVGTLAAGAGATLIALALRRRSARSRNMSVSTYAGRGAGGLLFGMRF